MEKFATRAVLWLLATCLALMAVGALPARAAEALPAVQARRVLESGGPRGGDLRYLLDLLEKEQPHFNRGTFDAAVAGLGDVEAMSDTEFYFAVRRVLAAAGDGHTRAMWSGSRLLGIWEVRRLDSGWYILGIQQEYRQALGAELVAVGGVPMDEVLRRAAPYISFENQTNLYNQFVEEIKNADLLEQIGVLNSSGGATLTVVNARGVKETVEMHTFPQEDQAQFGSGAWLSPATETGAGWENYRYTKLGWDTLFFQYNLCMEQQDRPVDQFSRELLRELGQGSCRKLIVDLRGNAGGMYGLMAPTLAQLAAVAGEKGVKLYCLIGEQTFSAGVMHAVQLRDLGAVLVGSPTGGNVNFYADTMDAVLPSSKIQLSYSTAPVVCDPDYRGDSLLPHHTAARRVQDVAAGVDSAVNLALDL